MEINRIKEILNDTIYLNCNYPHIGNNNLLAANWVMAELDITDIDLIYKFAKILERHASYDHEIYDEDFEIIINLLAGLLRDYKEILKYHTNG